MSRFRLWLTRALAETPVDRELHPSLKLPVVFRAYQKADFQQILAIYQLLAPGRFPEGIEGEFRSHFEEARNGIIVGELQGAVICTASLLQVGSGVYSFCYGLVHPRYQGQRIGSTMTLLRIAATAGSAEMHYATICAVHNSISFYRQFGFESVAGWTASDGQQHPFAVLPYCDSLAHRIGEVMRRRNIVIRDGCEAAVARHVRAEWIEEPGFRTLRLVNVAQGSMDAS